MASIDASELLRPGLLEGVAVLIAGDEDRAAVRGGRRAAVGRARSSGEMQGRALPARAGFGESVRDACAGLGARVSGLALTHDRSPGEQEQEAAVTEMVRGAVAELGGVAMLVVDAAGLIAAGAAARGDVGGHGAQAGGERAALRWCLQDAWSVTRAAFNVAFLPGEQGGRIVYLAPRAPSGRHAAAACAALENLARTLSIEWARHGITAVTIAPGEASCAQEIAALTAYLASPAGAYFSGCLLDLRGPAGG